MYYNRRAINKKPAVKPFDENGKLNKGFRYAGNGTVKDGQGNTYQISDFK
jgi:hypothetical protein